MTYLPMSIVHIITTIDLGGAEKQLLTLSTCQKKNGDDVEIIFLKGSPKLLDKFLSAGIKVNTNLLNTSFLSQILKLKKRQLSDVEVYHAHLPRAELLCALALRPKSFIVTRHNAERFFPRGPRFISVLLSRFAQKTAFALISISKAVNDFLVSSKEVIISENNHIIYYGLQIETSYFKDSCELNSGRFHIGTIARLVPQKNLPLLLNALCHLNKVLGAKVSLTIVGVGPLKDELMRKAIECGIQESVTWKGQISDVTLFYKSIDAFVLPSNYEGFGLVLLEAMQQGVPVIANDVSAIPEVLGKGHPGLLKFPNSSLLAETIWKMLSDRKLRQSCLSFQYDRIKFFSIERSYSSHKRVYLQLFEHSR